MDRNFFKEWQILKSGRRIDFAIIIAMTLIFLFVIAMNVRLIFQMTSNQTEEIGKVQLEGIRSDLQGTISRAENVTIQLALEAEQLLKARISQKELTDFFYRQKADQENLTGGACFNTYIANKTFTIIPDFDIPADYHATERLWYLGAAENPVKVYITDPYIDASGHGVCFTISKMLPDKETVVAIDFDFSDVQQTISRMNSDEGRTALIVTRTGMIIGYNDMALVGERISKKLPEYESILSRVIQSGNHESFIAQFDGSEHTIFSSSTSNGWYLILSVDNNVFYRESHRQIIFTTAISLVMMLAIIFFYLNAMKNGLRAENALRVKEEFLSRLSGELRDPLRNILNVSNKGVMKMDEDPAECAAVVRESALKLSDMLDNLFSFSTIVSRDKKNSLAEKVRYEQELSSVSRYARIGIISVLSTAMILGLAICVNTTFSWGDTKMNREVDTYEHQLSNWLENQRSILSMFVSLIKERPEFMDDYPAAVKLLNDIAKNYPEISACYIANPYKENPLIMNSGWRPTDPDWHVEQRPWYVETVKSSNKFCVSAPYYDAQTGVYCVTLSQIIYGENGEFIGIFGIDFYLDRLIHVLGESYTKDGYAFLVDRNGIIINHPNNNYQMSVSRMTDISGTEYNSVYSSGKVSMLRDYTGRYVTCLASKNRDSSFTVIVASSWWNIYGNIVLLSGFFMLLLIICVIIVRALINRQLRWQDSVNSQLKFASDTAVAASKAKSDFLAQMSHEIRTPINAVLGMNEMILRESHETDILDYATNIKSAGKTLLTLINSILDFSKIEDGKMEIIPVRYEIFTLIDDLVNMISGKAEKKALKFKTEIDSALPKSLYGDDVRIRQIITNLLTNAVKYTHAGSVTLSVTGTQFDDDTFELHVSVSDTGIGIREEDMGKLFQSFLRLDEERNRNIEGTGLGISIVQKLLAMMGSQLEVSSVYGEGSVFSFKLIQKVIDKTPAGNYSEHQRHHFDKDARERFLTAKGARVLAVDDNSMNLKVITGLLKRNDIIPDIAESGQQCIEMAKKNFYDIIFLDNMMPVLSGVDTLKILQRDKVLSDKTAVIMLTASAITSLREKYLGEGFTDYLTKPIDVGELESMLEKYLPPEIISFQVEGSKEIPAPVEIPEPAEEPKGDTFSANERKTFAEICPDINLETGMTYCMEMKSLYVEILRDYQNDGKAEQIQAAYDGGDWKNYQILVHALKSTSLSIGAENLSELARNLELASKDNNINEIHEKHGDLMATYKKIREQIGQWLKVSS